MISTTYSSAWRDAYTREIEYFTDHDTFFPLWDNWDRNCMPQSEAQRGVGNALLLLYAEAPRELVEKFLRRAIVIADRALAENKFREPGVMAFPRCRGEALVARAYARALLGEPLAEAELRQGVDDMKT